ncbi:MAG: AI-2E family transporter [Chitinophagaceae bacterium]|nr:AI-2E family transporter [Chitinophagaceae bacterium]
MMNTLQKIPANKIRQILFLTTLLSFAVLLFWQTAFLISAFLGAVALYMVLRLPMYKLVYEKKWKKWAAATLLMSISFVVIVLPFAWIGYILVDKISPYFNQPQIIIATFEKIQNYINQKIGRDLISQINISKFTEHISDFVTPLISSIANASLNIVFAYFLLWFLLTKSSEVEIWLKKNLPFLPENRSKVLAEVKESVMSNAVGLPIMGAIQGLLAMLGYWIFGVENPVLWGIVTGICSFIPFVGTMAAWIPIAILSFANGDINNGLGVTFWGLIVIGMSDNIFRLLIQKKLGDIHPLITVFGVVVGLNLFGFLGLIFGPLLISLFLLLVRIYLSEFVEDKT